MPEVVLAVPVKKKHTKIEIVAAVVFVIVGLVVLIPAFSAMFSDTPDAKRWRDLADQHENSR
ncbi:MAG: hypothetical protein ACRC62_08555 [Microcoleus sp.]